MAHKTLIGGTAYEIKGGKTLIGGTGYDIKSGRTLIGGTGYDVKFEPDSYSISIVNHANSVNVSDSQHFYTQISDDDTQYGIGSNIIVPKGATFKVFARMWAPWSAFAKGSIYLNGECLVSVKSTKGAATYIFTAESNILITVLAGEAGSTLAYVTTE